MRVTVYAIGFRGFCVRLVPAFLSCFLVIMEQFSCMYAFRSEQSGQ